METLNNFMSPTISKLAISLSKFQGSVGPIPKNKEVEVVTAEGKKYTFRYADLPMIEEVIQKPLMDNELAISHLTFPDGDKEYVITILLHSSGEFLMCKKRVEKREKLQLFGSDLSYVKRYQTCSILNISAEDDDDANAADGNTFTRKNSQEEDKSKLSSKQKSFLEGLLGQLNEPSYAEVVCKKYKLDTIYDIPREKFNDLVEHVKSKIEGKKNAAA